MTFDPRLLDPIVVGATGGSGTRAIARIMRTAGVHIGSDLNDALDDLQIADFHNRWINRWLTERRACEDAMKAEFLELLREHLRAVGPGERWGWKCPTSIYLLPFFNRVLPRYRFVHLIRDGRDMAISRNQNQLLKHGDSFLGNTGARGPRRSITLWSRVNEAAADFGARRLGDRYLRVRFEDLCGEPADAVAGILAFMELEADLQRCVDQVEPPDSLGRWRAENAARLARLEDVAGPSLRRFGYLASERPVSDA